MKSKNGQVTIFIIIGIIIIASVVAFFAFRDSFNINPIPASIEPAYNSFLSCLEDDTFAGISILGSQGGYIELPAFEPGSTYMPFSNQLNFLGNGIPYWYYVSGNNIQKEEVPTKSEMENQLADYLNGKINRCKFDNYYVQGFEISMGEPDATVKINDNDVRVYLSMSLNITKGEDTFLIKSHDVNVNSNLGALYKSAKKIYDYEQQTLFLEEYGIDTLRLYAPVDGVELTCAPLTWNSNEVFSKIQDAIEANTAAIKVKGGNFALKSQSDKYFVNDISVEDDVRFLNSKNWPFAYEVNPTEGNVLISKPVGNQEGLGILGFCYVPYHYVYSMKYPVLVQVSSRTPTGTEIFQFPLAIVIQGNNPRIALNTTAVDYGLPEICDKKNTKISVNVYDASLNPVEAEISYECFGVKCDIGKTSSGVLSELFPQCVNGDVIVRPEGYEETRYQYSTISSGSVDVIVDKIYNLNVNLKLEGIDYNGDAIITFSSDDGSASTIIYPNQKSIELSQGQYSIEVQIYKNSSITLGATKSQQCLDVPQSGLGGFFGFTKEKCYTIEFPAQTIGNTLAGGGKQNYYILESELSNSGELEINAQKLPTPTTIEQLQNNYVLFDEKNLGVTFK